MGRGPATTRALIPIISCAVFISAVVAEKFQAMVFLGTLNSRMKDFYDIW